MYVIAMAMFTLAVISLWLRWHGGLYSTRWFLRALVMNDPGRHRATLAGWYTAEIGRQPYVIYGLLRTADALSPVPAATLLLTLVTFVWLPPDLRGVPAGQRRHDAGRGHHDERAQEPARRVEATMPPQP